VILKQYEHIEIPKIPELSRQNIAGERYYVNGDGVGYPSMTTVLSIRGKEGIYEWRKRVGNEEANRITKRSTTRGTLFHSLLEQKIGKIYCIEDYLYSDEYGIAGAVDMVAEWDGKISVVDFKTSNRELREEWVENYFIQGTGYAKMFTERTGIPCDQLIIFAVPDNGIPQTFIKNVDDYTELLREAIRDYDNHKSKRAA